MPTSSQSKILSVIDYQLIQQQATGQDEITKPTVHITSSKISGNESKRRSQKDDPRSSIENKNNEDNHSPSPTNITDRRLSSSKNTDGLQSARTSQRSDILHVPVINLNDIAHNQPRIPSSSTNVNDNRQSRTVNKNERTKPSVVDSTIQSFQYRRNSLNSDNDDQIESEHKSKQIKKYPTPMSAEENTSSPSDFDYGDDDDDNNLKRERRPSLLNDNARRLLILGTIRPSKTFYKNLSDADADHLMEYFRRMKTTHQRMTSEEIHQELTTKFVEYKPKIFFDSATVTKSQVTHIEKIIEEYADTIRTHKAEFVKLENPMRFVIKQVDNNKPLITIPREYNDCFITLVTRSDPLRKSNLVTELIKDKLLEDVKANSLDISYFPGGVNYDVPRDEIDENGQMNVEIYQKLKKRLNNRQVWYFNGPPEKKPNALLAILPPDITINIDHQRLYDALVERLKTLSTQENSNREQQILSIQFVPLNCILNSNDISNQYIVECNTIETKQKLMEKPLKIVLNKQSIIIEFHSYDENIHREYEKFIKSEKYRELIKNHDVAVKRKSKTK
ncbi:unnamed protein product [Rotaria sordida]|uniref:Uncharacterized protein n=1 Tax=Rotaria sordida TaxID=392033 RepID=A0A818FBS6_9BILA|nr:unnamed protein product [Rotaria sordida]